MSTDYEKAVNALTKDVKDMRDDMKDVIAAVKAKAGSYVDDAKASVHESAAHRLDQVHDAADAVRQRYDDGLESCASKIAERPFVSVLAALGVGWVLGRLMRWHGR